MTYLDDGALAGAQQTQGYWHRVVGAVSVALGGQAVLRTLWTLPTVLRGGMPNLTTAIFAAGGLILIAGGWCCWQRRRAGFWLHVVWLVSVLLQMSTWISVDSLRRDVEDLVQLVSACLYQLAYPLVVLFWMFHPRIGPEAFGRRAKRVNDPRENEH